MNNVKSHKNVDIHFVINNFKYYLTITSPQIDIVTPSTLL